MRFLHTSDWHLGRTTYGASRRPDMEAVFEEMLAIGRDFCPDLILHSGDLFDGFRPPVEEMKSAHEMLTRLAELAPVLVVAGNHDSAALFELLNEFYGGGRIRLVPRMVAPSQGGLLEYPGPDGELARVVCLPFLHANRVVDLLEVAAENRTLTYADRIGNIQQSFAQVLAKSYDAGRHIDLVLAHLHVEGATWSQSERALHVSANYASRMSSLPPVSYAAYGHIHKPQALPGGLPGRYCGSPIPLDFGEEGEEKQVVLVEARPGRGAEVRPVALTRGRPLRTLSGTQAQLEARVDEVGEALLRLVVHSQEPMPQLAQWASETFAKATLLDVSERLPGERLEVVGEGPHEDVSSDLPAAFATYLSEHGPDTLNHQELLELFSDLYLRLGQEDAWTSSALTELDKVLEGVS